MAITVERLEAEINANPAGAIAALGAFDAAAAAAAKDRTAHINIDVDRRGIIGAQGAIDTIEGALGGLKNALGDIAGGAGGAGGGFFQNLADGAGDFGRSVAGAIPSMALMAVQGAAIYTAVAALPGALSAAAGAAGALVGALAPLTGLLGAIPVGIGALGGGLLATTIGLSGVTKALGLSNNAMSGSATKVADLSRRQRELAASYRGLRQAQQSQAQAAQELTDAQKNLAAVPKEYAEALSDQRRALRAAVLNEESAVLRLKQAQENLANAQNKTADSGATMEKAIDAFTGKTVEIARQSATAVDGANNEAEARLAVKQAELAVRDAKDASADQQKRLNDMTKKGLKGSDLMVAAQRRLKDAQWRVASSADGVVAAQDRIKDAQAALKKTQDGTTAGTNAYNKALAALPPEGRRFVRFMKGEFLPAWHDIKHEVEEQLLPGIQGGLENILTRSKNIGKALGDMGGTVGKNFESITKMWSSDKRSNQLDQTFVGLNRVLDKTLKLASPLSRIFVSITQAATPMVEKLENGIMASLTRLADWMETNQGKKSMGKFFDQAAKYAGLWMDVLKPIGGIFKGITRAADPLATSIMKDLAGYFGKLSDKINSKKGQKALKAWFHDQLPAIRETGRLIRDIGDLLFGSSKGGKDSAFYTTIHELRVNELPKLKKLLENMDKGDFGSDFLSGIGDLTDAVTAFQESDTASVIDAIATAMVNVGKAFKFLHESSKIDGKTTWLERMLGRTPESERAQAKTYASIKGWFNKVGRSFKTDFLDKFPGMGKAANDWWNKYINGDQGLGGALRATPDMTSRWFKKVRTSFVEDFVNPIKKWGKDVGKSFREDFLGEFPKLLQGLKDWFGKIIDSFKKDFLGGFYDGINAIDIHIPSVGVGKVKTPEINFSPSVDNPFKQFGGPVQKGQSYIVGEKRPEVFVPSTSGRIMPSTNGVQIKSNGEGITDAQLERILERVLEKARPNVSVDYQPGETVDPKHMAAEIAWSLR